MSQANDQPETTPEAARESVDRLWHLRRGFEAAFFIAFLVLVFGITFHRTAYDMYLDAFLGGRVVSAGVGGLSDVTASGGVGLRTGWLWWVIAYGLSEIRGLAAVSLVAALLTTAGFGVLLAALKRRFNMVLSAFALVGAAYLSRLYFAPSGQAAGIFLFGALSGLLAAGVASARRRFWLAVPLMILWVNLDLSWPAGAALCLGFLPAMITSASPRKGEKIAALLVALAVIAVNPDFVSAYQVVWRFPFTDAARAALSPVAAAGGPGMPLAYAVSGLAVVLAIASRDMLAVHFVLTAGLLVIAGTSVATFPFAAIAAMSAIAAALPGTLARAFGLSPTQPGGFGAAWVIPFLLPERAAGVERTAESESSDAALWRARRLLGLQSALCGAGVLALLALFSVTAVGSSAYAFGAGMEEGRLPARAMVFIEKNGLKGAVLARPLWAGYVLWTAYPAVRPVACTKPFSTDAALARDVAWMFSAGGARPGEAVARLERSGAALALVPLDWTRAGASREGLVPVYWDDTAAIFVRDTPANSKLIAASDARLTYPPYFGFGLTAEKLPDVIRQLENQVANYGRSAHAEYELGMCYWRLGEDIKAHAHLSMALGMDPSLVVAYQLMGDIATKEKNIPAARQFYSEAIRIDPLFAMAYIKLGNLYFEGGDWARGVENLIAAQRADDKRPQLDRLKPGLRQELNEQVKKATTPPQRPKKTAAAPSTGSQLAPGVSTASSVGSSQSTGL